ncbi:MAG: heparinase II/III-family protein [Planctomycetota bacterium]|nr:heparinase II/III-family protein [Planctomycetota bacterium]
MRRAHAAFVLVSMLTFALPAWGKGAKDKGNDADPEIQLKKVPARDPEVSEPKRLLKDVLGQHPRLLFSKDELAKLKEKIAGPGKADYEGLLAYLKACNPPKLEEVKFTKDATDAQRHGLWRLPTAALHYALTGEKSSFEKTKGYMELLLKLPVWEDCPEVDSGMGAANVMIGAALAYDWLYEDLEPEFREAYRTNLLLRARRMYHLGHLQKADATHYWQQDPQNNHRHHRLAGLALCALASAEGKPEEDWIVTKTWEELKFVADWHSPDGSYHDSPSYMPFGVQYLVLAFDAADRCFGTDYLDHGFFANNALFRLQTLAPGFKQLFCYGDSGLTAMGSYNNYLLRCAAKHRDKDVYAGILEFFKAQANAAEFKWFSILWSDPALESGSLDAVAKTKLYPDLGLAFVRDGWKEKSVAAMFKCGPYGGYTLNRYRNENDFHYINIAHDHPDANSFQLFAGGEMLATDDGYPQGKWTEPHNTILVDGKGQLGESGGWTQPPKGVDLTTLARTVAFKDAGNVVVAQGEAAGLYQGLTRFRRGFVWVRGGYVLVLDEIGAKAEAEIAWLLHSPELSAVDAAAGTYRLKKGEAACAMQLLSAPAGTAEILADEEDKKGKKSPRGQKLHYTAKTAQWRVAAVFDPWAKGDLKLSAEGSTARRQRSA